MSDLALHRNTLLDDAPLYALASLAIIPMYLLVGLLDFLAVITLNDTMLYLLDIPVILLILRVLYAHEVEHR